MGAGSSAITVWPNMGLLVCGPVSMSGADLNTSLMDSVGGVAG